MAQCSAALCVGATRTALHVRASVACATPHADASPRVAPARAEFAGQFYNKSDLEAYARMFNVELADTTVVGPNTPTQPGLEAQMDIELMMTVAPHVHTYFWSTGACAAAAVPSSPCGSPVTLQLTRCTGGARAARLCRPCSHELDADGRLDLGVGHHHVRRR